MHIGVKLVCVALTASCLTACACWKRTKAENPVTLPVELVLGNLEVALHGINQLAAWDPLKQRAKYFAEKCDEVKKAAVLDEERMCTPAQAAIAAACGCTKTGCAATGSDACLAAIERSTLACSYAKAQDAQLGACKLSAAHKVPTLKQAEVTLQVAREDSQSGGLNVLLLKAGASQVNSSGQTISFVLTPKPKVSERESAVGDPTQKAAEALRRDLLAAVEEALKVMAMDEFDVPDHGRVRPSVAPDELRFTAEIYAKGTQSFGLAWEAPSGIGGINAGAGSSESQGNKVTLVFKR